MEKAVGVIGTLLGTVLGWLLVCIYANENMFKSRFNHVSIPSQTSINPTSNMTRSELNLSSLLPYSPVHPQSRSP